jgi:hypothetical protein
VKSRLPKILLAIFFVALLATPLVIRWANARRERAESIADTNAALARYGFRLEEVSKACGIDFVHRAPQLDPKLSHIMPQVASMGAAISVVDFDRDGWQDLYATNSGEGSLNSLYRNQGDFQGCRPGAWNCGCQSGRDGRVDGRGVGRLRRGRLRRPLPLQVGAARAVS